MWHTQLALSWIILRVESIRPDFFSRSTDIDPRDGGDVANIWHIFQLFLTLKVKFNFELDFFIPTDKMAVDRKFAYWPPASAEKQLLKARDIFFPKYFSPANKQIYIFVLLAKGRAGTMLMDEHWANYNDFTHQLHLQ